MKKKKPERSKLALGIAVVLLGLSLVFSISSVTGNAIADISLEGTRSLGVGLFLAGLAGAYSYLKLK